jgi:GDSL-like Lipase/Acylhydrolase family/Starch binding domain
MVGVRAASAVSTTLWKGAAGTLVAFALVEALLRVAYLARDSAVEYVPMVYGYDFGPTPPWFDGLRILEADPVLIWKNRRSVRRKYLDMFGPAQRDEDRMALLRQFLPGLPPFLKGQPIWEMSLNSAGFRDVEFPHTKSPSTFRIVCLGDSWTFGANVGQHQAYPQRLQARLRQEFPTGDFEVLNLGVVGYSSFQGLQLLKQEGLALEPDFIVVGFATNDASMAGWRDKDMSDKARSDLDRKEVPAPVRRRLMEGVEQRLGGWVQHIESYKLLRYMALVAKRRPRSMSEHFKDPGRSPEHPDQPANGDQREEQARVSPHDYEKNILEMIDLARQRGVGAVLLFNEFVHDSPYRAALEKISRMQAVSFVDMAALLAAARKKIEDELETRLDLRPLAARRGAPGETVEVVFRVYLGTRPVPKAMYIVGNHPALGSGVPNLVAMYADGTHGDQRAGDAVWSYSARIPRQMTLKYVYTNSGEQGRWEGLDVPAIRSVTADAPDSGDRVYLPIESFGKIYMRSDPWHTDASGYELIVSAIIEALKRNYLFQRHLERRSGKGP